MPIYDYACDKCGHEFSAEQRITDKPLKTCPECRSRKVKRLISRTSFVLKGGGWYSDLYSSPKQEAGGEKPGADSKSDAGEKSGGEAPAGKDSSGKSDEGSSKPKAKGKAAAA